MKRPNALLLIAWILFFVLVALNRQQVFGIRSAPTIMWGDDFMKAHPDIFKNANWKTDHYQFIHVGNSTGPSYELGLRSDGVVVWREIK